MSLPSRKSGPKSSFNSHRFTRPRWNDDVFNTMENNFLSISQTTAEAASMEPSNFKMRRQQTASDFMDEDDHDTLGNGLSLTFAYQKANPIGKGPLSSNDDNHDGGMLTNMLETEVQIA
eukprot:CAMPEP_0194415534 /NCGR_PEP_ID=MMETSP0176-20130528/14320_1 /TAXON_ID=216777 /ORGANISM="Proboscia alata, Strain PI-D3" /LENGTH=118 /DNA_ID=CAMNT_0039220235 /DNA_START=125 /DNA_END=477 /DNA_ORIENTATION=+